MTRSRLAAGLVALALLGSGANTRATAKEPDAAYHSPAETREAEERWAEGRNLYEAGQIDEARLKYAQAFAVLQRTNVLWNLAIAEFYANRPLDALKHFKQFESRPDADAADVKRAREKYISEASKVTGHIAVEAAPGLEVLVDHELQRGATPLGGPVDVSPGVHEVKVRYEGAIESRSVACAAGEVVTATFALRGARDSQPQEGLAHAKARSGALITLSAVAVAALGVGAVFAIDSKRRDEDNVAFRSQNPSSYCGDRTSSLCQTWQSRLDDQQRSATLAKALYVGSAALAAGAIVTWFAWPRVGRESGGGARAWLSPAVALGTAGVQAGGAF